MHLIEVLILSQAITRQRIMMLFNTLVTVVRTEFSSTDLHFKLAVLAFKALHDRLPSYLAEDCQLVAVTGRRRLRSSHIDTCQVRRTNTRFGDRSFSAARPRTWNSLPIQLRDSELSLGQFRRLLMTHLYKHIFGYWQLQRRVTVFFVRWAYIDLLTYLLTYTWICKILLFCL